LHSLRAVRRRITQAVFTAADDFHCRRPFCVINWRKSLYALQSLLSG
jgi:hypothetical protein